MEVSTPSQAGVFDPGKGRIGPALFELPPSHFEKGIQHCLPFLQGFILKHCRYTLVSSKSVLDAIHSIHRPNFQIKRRCTVGKSLLDLFLRKR